MTVITRRPDNRLSRIIWAPGGKTVAQALEDAQGNLEEGRLECLDALRVKLEEIQALGRKAEQAPKLAIVQTLYSLSSEVLDMAGVYGMPELGQAAYSLCELLDNLAARKMWNWPAVQVHLNGLLLLADPVNAQPEARQHVIDGLRQVCRRVATR
ncbi:MAG: CheE protein [Caulobacteraceae bacterium]|nr:CheE protein [Caulobacteraceae bacterium]